MKKEEALDKLQRQIDAIKTLQTRGQVLQSSISKIIMGVVIIFGVIHKKVPNLKT